MAYQRPVHTGIWTNKKFHDKLNVNDKMLFVYLLTNNHITQLGVYELPIYIIVGETSLTEKDVKDSLAKLEELNMIKYSEETNEVAIISYNKYSLLVGGKVAQSCFNNIENDVKDKSLLLPVYEKLLSVHNSYEDDDSKKQEKKAILEYAKRKIKECLEFHGLLDNSDDESNNKIDEKTSEEEIQYDGSDESVIKISKRDMERNPQNSELYEARIKVSEFRKRLYSLNYDAYTILNELNYYDIANVILEVDDINHLKRCADDLENVLNNLDSWQWTKFDSRIMQY